MDYPIVKSFHTHARGEDHGWFGAGMHPSHLDSEGRLVMGTEWRVQVDKAQYLEEAQNVVDKKVDVELRRRWMGTLFNYTCDTCQATMPVTYLDGQEPIISHEKKSKQHRVGYKEIDNVNGD